MFFYCIDNLRYRSEKEKNRLQEAGVGEEVVNAAVSEFIFGLKIFNP